MKYIILDGDPIHQITLTAKPKGMELGLKLIARHLPIFNTYSHLLHMTDMRTHNNRNNTMHRRCREASGNQLHSLHISSESTTPFYQHSNSRLTSTSSHSYVMR